jgi:xanthine dehydrogenase YagT iron-sulfur-binding subunit
MSDNDKENISLSRRGFFRASAGGAALLVGQATLTARVVGEEVAKQEAGKPLDLRAPVPLTLRVNNRPYEVKVDVRTTLLDTLREQLHLTGTKKGCDHGQCGACTVMVNGQTVAACLTLAVSVQGDDIRTIEGVATSDTQLHPLQEAFIKHDAFQCGYCTSGQIMAALHCLEQGLATSPESIREAMSGNLCRCAAYPNILAAITEVANAREA